MRHSYAFPPIAMCHLKSKWRYLSPKRRRSESDHSIKCCRKFTDLNLCRSCDMSWVRSNRSNQRDGMLKPFCLDLPLSNFIVSFVGFCLCQFVQTYCIQQSQSLADVSALLDFESGCHSTSRAHSPR